MISKKLIENGTKWWQFWKPKYSFIVMITDCHITKEDIDRHIEYTYEEMKEKYGLRAVDKPTKFPAEAITFLNNLFMESK